MNTLKTKVWTPTDVKVVLFVLTLVMFILGAGAPSDGGHLGG
jgi:hypothetical protein